MNLNEHKDLIEKYPIALATTMSDGRPNVIGVAYAKVVSENQLVITDNYMNQTLEDIKLNKNVCLNVWDEEMKGCKMIGTAEYFTDGEWLDFVRELKENEGYPAKGAVLVTVEKNIKSD